MNMIFEHVIENGRKVGILAATINGSQIQVGWSRVNFSAGDKFNRDEGIRIALARARGEEEAPKLVRKMQNQMREFQIRALRYFKGGTFANNPPIHIDPFKTLFNSVTGKNLPTFTVMDAELNQFAQFLGMRMP